MKVQQKYDQEKKLSKINDGDRVTMKISPETSPSKKNSEKYPRKE